MRTGGRLPGITFEVVPPKLPTVLPRMDIAALVGFAAAGPIDVPVPVEDQERFRDVFGGELPLAQDPDTGELHHAHLGPAVASFFDNGGRRCWVVRVAGDAASANQFPVPGLWRVDGPRGRFGLSLARARAHGSWSDRLSVGAVLDSRWLPPGATGTAFDPRKRSLTLTTAAELERGDLLRITFPEQPLQLLLVADTVQTTPSGLRVTWAEDEAHWLGVLDPALPTPVAERAVRLTPGPPQDLDLLGVELVDPAAWRYQVSVAAVGAGGLLVPGDMLVVDFDAGSLLLLLDTVDAASEAGSPPGAVTMAGGPGWLTMAEPAARARLAEGAPGFAPAQPEPLVERLRFELLVWRGEELEARIGDLAGSARQPRCWEGLPTDDDLFGEATAGTELREQASSPRFPIAGPARPGGRYLPLGMATRPSPETAAGPLASADSPLRRDGLEGFDANLFLDKRLRHADAGSLAAEAQRLLASDATRLRGLHGLLPIDEVTIVAVPDAAHRRWEPGTRTIHAQAAPAAPWLHPPLVDGDTCALSWSPVPGATGYSLQQSASPELASPTTLDVGPVVSATLEVDGDCPTPRYFRVRAIVDRRAGAWSNTRVAMVPSPAFEDCAGLLTAPRLRLRPDASGDRLLLRWSDLGVGTYDLEEAADPDFGTRASRRRVATTALQVERPVDAVRYHRVRAAGAAGYGPWSNTESSVPPPVQVAVVVGSAGEEADDLLAVQQALLRLCAYRGDMLAVLSLPPRQREQAALEHLHRLVAERGGMDDRTLSFGALYHPWLVAGSQSLGELALRLIPPDGAVCGSIARRTLERGAWLAPANLPLLGTVALDPALTAGAGQPLLAAGVNLIAPDPRGFVALAADTLTGDASLRPIGARRLLSLLRRLALREGATYVFENNDAAFLEEVRRRFDRLLADLYGRGAFAGATAPEGYRVVADESVNPPPSVDLGRLIVELRVAPSQPLTFIAVRLLQTATDGLVLQEV